MTTGTSVIDGIWASSTTPREIRNPFDNSIVGEVSFASLQDVDSAAQAARRAFDDPQGWSGLSYEDRAVLVIRFAEALERATVERATVVSQQNGMPISLANSFEGVFPPVFYRYFADLIRETKQSDIRPGLLGGFTEVQRKPVGVVGIIVPWNVPQAIAAMALAPALVAGCTVVLKPAEETVLDALMLAEAAAEAGIPAGVINIVPGGRDIGAAVVEHPLVAKVAFTGSTGAGRAIAAKCGELLKPVTLELGGKSAAVILDDADLASIRSGLQSVSMINNGQICWLNSRILAPANRYDEVVDAVTTWSRELVVGNPLDPSTELGPLISARQLDHVQRMIQRAAESGATITTGGGQPAGLEGSLFIEPTVIRDAEPGSEIAQKEVFGPVLTVLQYKDEEDAVRIANHSEYGLGGSVWTSDPERGRRVADRIESGTVGVNGYANDPTAPFGGIKASGLGRELGPEGLDSFFYKKSIYLDKRR